MLGCACTTSGDVFRAFGGADAGCEWVATGESVRRSNWVAVTLSDGTVLVAGGERGGNALASAAIFDPVAQKFFEVGPLAEARITPLALPERRGEAWIVGGAGSAGLPLPTVERYDLARRVFLPGPSMAVPRDVLVGTYLADGRLIVAGGRTPAPTTSVEILAPDGGPWVMGPATSDTHIDAASAMLLDGRWLVAGGGDCDAGGSCSSRSSTVEIFDPSSNSFGAAASMSLAKLAFTATTLSNGRVLTFDGALSEVYDPLTDGWAATPYGGPFSSNHTATVLLDGSVLIAGGRLFSSMEIFDRVIRYLPATNQYQPAAAMNEARHDHAAARLPSGEVLVVGGDLPTGGYAGAELYDATADRWTVIDSAIVRCQR